VKFLLRSLLIPMAAALCLSDARAQAGGKSLPPIARVKSGVNLFIELHNHLLFASHQAEDTFPEYRTEAKAYREAHELMKDPAAMQIVTNACIAGPDIATIGKAATNLPAGMAAPDQEAVRKMIGAIVSAWPRFKQQDGPDRNRSLQMIWSRVLVKSWGQVQDRLLTTLYDKFAFEPLDKPITVYPVLEANELGASGVTDKGYYTIIPVMKAPGFVVIEELLHEVTHVIDEHQPPGSRSLLIRLRQAGGRADPETLDAFMHGLIAWNAGELIRRFVNADYKPLYDISPDVAEPLVPYLPTYQGPWVGYLEGKISADEVIKGMAASLKPAGAAPAAAPKTGKTGS